MIGASHIDPGPRYRTGCLFAVCVVVAVWSGALAHGLRLVAASAGRGAS